MAFVLLDDRGQPVLRLKDGAALLLALENAGTDQRPVMAEAEIEQVVKIDGLVGAVEVADTEMNDAALERRTLVFRPGHLGGQGRQAG